MMEGKVIRIYVQLLDEGTDTAKGVDAVDLGNGFYKLLPGDNYDPEDETWEFLPGSVVRCIETTTDKKEDILLAIKQVG